jgi:hypothetical protein
MQMYGPFPGVDYVHGVTARRSSRLAIRAPRTGISVTESLIRDTSLDVRSQGDDGIDARGTARRKIRRQQRHGCQGP